MGRIAPLRTLQSRRKNRLLTRETIKSISIVIVISAIVYGVVSLTGLMSSYTTFRGFILTFFVVLFLYCISVRNNDIGFAK